MQGPSLVSRSVEHQSHLKRLGAKSASEFARSPKCQRLRSIDPSMLSHNFRKATQDLTQGQASLLVQLRSGHVPLQKYLHKIGKANSPTCPACRAHDETVHHYLLTCPAYRIQRGELERTLRRAAQTIRTLLANPKAFPHLFRYVNATRRFRRASEDEQQGTTQPTLQT